MGVRLSDHFNYKKLFTAVLPTILMMMFTSLYSIIDGIFVSNFTSTDAFAGLNLIMPVTMIIGSLGFMLGAGGSALTSMTLGQGNRERANKIFSMIVYFNIILGLVISTIVFIFIEPIAIALGSVSGQVASQIMIDNAVLYGRILLIFMVMFMLQNVFQSFFVVAEKAKNAFIMTIVAGLTNIFLDALFVAILKWGLVGAALATGISQTIAAIIGFVYFSRRNNSLLKLTKTKLEFLPLLKSCTNGSSEFISNTAASVVSILFNIQLLKYAGVNGVAAYGIIMYASFIFNSVFIGYSIGVSPLIGYNYGARNTKELKNILKKSLVITLIFSIIMLLSVEFFAGALSSVFTHGNNELLELTTKGFRIFGLSFLLCGFNLFISGFFTALNDGITSAIVSFTRTGIFQICCITIVPIWLELTGVWLSVVIAEIMAICVSITFLILKKNKFNY